MRLQIRRGTNTERALKIFAMGELVWVTDEQQLVVGDGQTQGGIAVSGGIGISDVASMFTNGIHDNISFTYDQANGVINATVDANVDTVDVQTITAAMFTAGTHSNISFTYDQINNVINATVNAGGTSLKSRDTLIGSTGNINNDTVANVNINGYRGYMLYKIETSTAAWVRLYVSDAARTADAARTQGQDPLPGSGVVAEVITTNTETVIIAPGVIGFNNESPVSNIIPIAVTNLSGGSADITVTLTAVELEV
jgi:hypothetical protein